MAKAILGQMPTPCPTSLTKYVSFPSILAIFTLMALLSLIFALIIIFKYNYVKVFNRKIRADIISNTLWVAFYVFVAIRATAVALRYGIGPPQEISSDVYTMALVLICQTLVVLMLTFALNYQRRFRSAKMIPKVGRPSTDSFRGINSLSASGSNRSFSVIFEKSKKIVRKHFRWLEIFYVILFLLCIVSIIVACSVNSEVTFLIFINLFVLQHLPVFFLVLYIVIWSKRGEGPTVWGKLWLSIATLLNMTNDIPTNYWAGILPKGCPLYICSWVDLIHIAYLLSLFFFFLFARSEFKRNIEECIWTTMGEIQETFDIRKF